MLDEAIEIAKDKKIDNASFILKSVTELTKEDLDLKNQKENLNISMIVCYYGFSALRNHEESFNNTVSLLSEGGSYVIADQYRERTAMNRISHFLLENVLVAANCFLKYSDYIKDNLVDFEIKEKTVSDNVTRLPTATMVPYIVRGVKRTV